MLKRAACFTDIHWGKKNNSEIHNQDCLRFVEWFCENVKNNKEIDHIIFMGDWFEHRSAINGLTLDYAYKGAKLLKDLGMPVYFIVGNHDLYYRYSRDVYSTNFFDSLGFILINEPTVIEETYKPTLLCPFLFESEYPSLAQYFTVPIWFGHFEFKGFVVTGDTKKMDHGPDPDDFEGPTRIFSGHFHKRQSNKNITYIGNTFPVDFSDANDTERGMSIYDYENDDMVFIDWNECPSYIKTDLKSLIADAVTILKKDATVKCLVNMDIDYEKSIKLKEQLVTKYALRYIELHESPEIDIALQDTEVDDSIDQLDSTDSQVRAMLGTIEAPSIDNDKLIAIYGELNVE
jgi:DNA repair exonuclease SbcCD nuclease subunit